MSSLIYLNDTKRTVSIHPATFNFCDTEDRPIEHLESRVFRFHDEYAGKTPWIKMWDYGSTLSIMVGVEDNE